MLYLDNIKVEFKCQYFKKTHLGIRPQKDKTVLFLESFRKTKTVRCPECGIEVYVYDNAQVSLKDIPIWHEVCHELNFTITNGEKLSTNQAENLKAILSEHNDPSVYLQ